MAVAACLLVGGVPGAAGTFLGVVEADDVAEFYVNGQYMQSDMSVPLLPMNSERSVPTTPSTYAVGRPTPFVQGDLIAMYVISRKPIFTMVGKIEVQTFAGVVAAFADGTVTSSDWKCTTTFYPAWILPDFSTNTSDWQPAEEHTTDCCPWRDSFQYWNHLKAKWISPIGLHENATGSRDFYCRYRIPPAEPADGELVAVSRLPVIERQRMGSEDINGKQAPLITVTGLEVSASVAQVLFTVNVPAKVYCGVVNMRYQLRVPTPMEILTFGRSLAISSPTAPQWFIKHSQTTFDYDLIPAIANGWFQYGTMSQCKTACMSQYLKDGSCAAITYHTVGFEPTNGANCKLMAGLNETLLNTTQSFQVMSHMYIEEAVVEFALPIAGLLVPGTMYASFCATEQLVQEVAEGELQLCSTWNAVAETKQLKRATGCLDCGAKPPPEVYVLGGWASHDKLAVVVSSNVAGLIYCIALPLVESTMNISSRPVAASILAAKANNFLAVAGLSVMVQVVGLQPSTLYELFCIGESNGGVVSSQAQIEATRRPWRTEATPIPLVYLHIEHDINLYGYTDITIQALMSIQGYTWCKVLLSEEARKGVPDAKSIFSSGLQSKIEDSSEQVDGMFRNYLSNVSYDLYCTAAYSDFKNASEIGIAVPNPYPTSTILKGSVHLDSIQLQVTVSRGPARVKCKAIAWRRRPSSEPPPAPTRQDFAEDYVMAEVEGELGAVIAVEFEFLSTGSWHDVFCYSVLISPPPLGIPADMIRIRGMGDEAIADTRTSFFTQGPRSEEGGWLCVVGRPCSVTGLYGVDLSTADRLLARVGQCPGPCRCKGEEDPWKKGAVCTSVFQGPNIANPPPGYETSVSEIDKLDPRGAWCYVKQGTCDDATMSNHTAMLVSWQACTASAGLSGPAGFPNNGLAYSEGTNGDAFNWGSGPLLAEGSPYQLCWCNSTLSPCTLLLHFRFAVGVLHVAGPSRVQLNGEMTCVAGTPCTLEHFDAHAAFDESRLAVVPSSDQGCNWARYSLFSYPGVERFPWVGVSLPATDYGRTYSWGASPVLTFGGSYLLCWCGAVPKDAASHRRRTVGNGLDNLPKALAYDCAPVRPDGGMGYLAPAGELGVIGPSPFNAVCNIGMECVLQNVPGYGLQNGDLMAILKTCGDVSPPPPGWLRGVEGHGDPPDGWRRGGWMQWGEQLSEQHFGDLGAPVPSLLGQLDAGDEIERGVWGFPNLGISAGPSEGAFTIPGMYRWGKATWALSGNYQICWCARSRGEPCFLPRHFRVDVGALTVTGSDVLPAAHQVHACVRGRRCDIQRLEGNLASSAELLFSGTLCGSDDVAPAGMPNDGYSLPSQDGKFFSWKGEPITCTPGKYRICSCPTRGFCSKPSDYGTFAGILSVTGPLSPLRFWFCGLNTPCNISGVYGEGMVARDNVKVMVACGTGESPSSFANGGNDLATYNLGTLNEPQLTFELPPSTEGGRFRACYCPADSICVRGEDYFVDLGQVEVGGPDPNLLYTCYEWRPCTLSLGGSVLRDGDRVVAVRGGRGGCEARHAAVEGWPLDGVSLPAGGGEGRTITWGEEAVLENFVIAEPGLYELCWCSSRKREEEYLFLGIGDPDGDLDDDFVVGNESGNGSRRLRRRLTDGVSAPTMSPATEAPTSAPTPAPTQGFQCSKVGPFGVSAGQLRIAPYREYQYVNRKPDPEERNSDLMYAYLLAIPLPVLFCLAIVLGWRRLAKYGGAKYGGEEEAEAPPLFTKRPALNDALREKASTMYAVQQVLETRITVREQLKQTGKFSKSGKKDDIPNFRKDAESLKLMRQREIPPWELKRLQREEEMMKEQLVLLGIADGAEGPSGGQRSIVSADGQGQLALPSTEEEEEAPTADYIMRLHHAEQAVSRKLLRKVKPMSLKQEHLFDATRNERMLNVLNWEQASEPSASPASAQPSFLSPVGEHMDPRVKMPHSLQLEPWLTAAARGQWDPDSDEASGEVCVAVGGGAFDIESGEVSGSGMGPLDPAPDNLPGRPARAKRGTLQDRLDM